jgi:hypothetical protein
MDRLASSSMSHPVQDIAGVVLVGVLISDSAAADKDVVSAAALVR